MLEILPIQTKIEQEAICARCGIAYEPDCMAYHAIIDGELMGICQFSVDAAEGRIRALALGKDAVITARDRTETWLIMGRAVLNFMDLCGAHIVYFEDAAFSDENLIRSIGFRRASDGRWVMDLDAFFSEPGHSGH